MAVYRGDPGPQSSISSDSLGYGSRSLGCFACTVKCCPSPEDLTDLPKMRAF